jgi:hypothetical protein
MSDSTHNRALQLIAVARVEGISDADRAWLSAHLEECTSCSGHAHQTDQALSSLRTTTISLPKDLAARTQFRVRLRAMELREREPKRRAVWLACAVSWIFGIASAPYVWNLFQWLGHRAGLPKIVWEFGFGLWWAVPALFAAAVVLLESARRGDQSNWLGQGS